MTWTTVLVDRARLVSMTPMPPTRIEGSTQASDTKGDWLKARLTLPGSPAEAGDPDTLRRRVTERPTLLIGRTADAINAAQRIEVDSQQLGRATWEVTGDPRPLRKRTTVIGYEVDLRRVNDHEAAAV